MKDGRRAGFVMSFRFAGRGLVWMARHEPNMRFHLVAAVGVLIGAAAFRLPIEQWAAVVFAITLVLLAEVLNSAIEAVLDLAHPGDHDLVRTVKDVSAAAVLVASLGATVIGAIVFVPHFWRLVF